MDNLFIHIKRKYGNEKHSIGTCSVIETDLPNDMITLNAIKFEGVANKLIPRFTSISLERGWLNNKPNESCIPVGEYTCVYEFSPRFERKLWEIYGVEGRSECKFHVANYYRQLNGCIALGLRSLFIDGDDNYDVSSSRDALVEFHNSLMDFQNKIIKLIVE